MSCANAVVAAEYVHWNEANNRGPPDVETTHVEHELEVVRATLEGLENSRIVIRDTRRDLLFDLTLDDFAIDVFFDLRWLVT